MATVTKNDSKELMCSCIEPTFPNFKYKNNIYVKKGIFNWSLQYESKLETKFKVS